MEIKTARIIVGIVDVIFVCFAIFRGIMFWVTIPANINILSAAGGAYHNPFIVDDLFFILSLFLPVVLPAILAPVILLISGLVLSVCLVIACAVYFFKTAFRGAFNAKRKYILLVLLFAMLAFWIYVILGLGVWKLTTYFCAITSINIALLLYDYLCPDLGEENKNA